MKLLLQNPQQLGKLGEDFATSYLRKEGYRILQRNYKARYGEIDIICVKDNTLVFVEVKSRTGSSFGTPEEAVTPRKLHEVIRTSEYYVLEHPNLPRLQRIDVIAVEFDGTNKPIDIRHIQNVTG